MYCVFAKSTNSCFQITGMFQSLVASIRCWSQLIYGLCAQLVITLKDNQGGRGGAGMTRMVIFLFSLFCCLWQTVSSTRKSYQVYLEDSASVFTSYPSRAKCKCLCNSERIVNFSIPIWFVQDFLYFIKLTYKGMFTITTYVNYCGLVPRLTLSTFRVGGNRSSRRKAMDDIKLSYYSWPPFFFCFSVELFCHFCVIG